MRLSRCGQRSRYIGLIRFCALVSLLGARQMGFCTEAAGMEIMTQPATRLPDKCRV